MELKLNIYEHKNITNTYTAESYDIMFGTVEDLIDVLELDKLNSEDDIELIQIALNVVMKGFDFIKPLLKDIFDGLTDEEIKHTKISEVASVLVDVVKFAIIQIGKGSNGKN